MHLIFLKQTSQKKKKASDRKWTTTLFNRCNLLVALVLSISLMVLSSGTGLCKNNNGNSTVAPSWLAPSPYVYDFKDKPDPFQPFVRSTTLSSPSTSKVPPKILTPLERVEPTQLNLVGILTQAKNPAQPLALVELPDGKGYILKKGTKVGQRQGIVTDILPNKIIITEKAKDLFGELHSKKIVLKLRNKATGANHE